MPTKIVTEGKQATNVRQKLVCDWTGSAVQSESTFHQLSPYIGKIKSSMAASLVSQFTSEGDLIYDPFSGSGTIALEAWARMHIC
jgi:23S rRNA G2445 N2-methylase RlmL